MSFSDTYDPGPAHEVQVQKDGEKWTLVLVRNLRHPPEKVWQAITDPAHLREWAPFDVEASLGAAGPVTLTWTGTGQSTQTAVTRADAPGEAAGSGTKARLEYADMRWDLEATEGGTRLTLWHSIDRRFIAWGAAGWHICFDILERALAGEPVARIVGPDAMKFQGWQRLSAEYAKQFGVETPAWGK